MPTSKTQIDFSEKCSQKPNSKDKKRTLPNFGLGKQFFKKNLLFGEAFCHKVVFKFMK
jgi:hypothetical protein